MRTFGTCIALLLASFLLTAAGARGDSRAPFHWVDYPLESGRYDGAGNGLHIAFEAIVRVPDASWLRLEFAECQLGAGSSIVCSSLLDGASEALDASGLASRQGGSAYFNGDRILLQLQVAPGDTDVFIKLERVLVGERVAGGNRTLCGDDDRVHSDDPAIGRMPLVTATAWISSIAALLTAGHACDDPAVMDVVEFNVPLSNPDGSMNHPPPEDQYPIEMASVLFNNDGEGNEGNDW